MLRKTVWKVYVLCVGPSQLSQTKDFRSCVNFLNNWIANRLFVGYFLHLIDLTSLGKKWCSKRRKDSVYFVKQMSTLNKDIFLWCLTDSATFLQLLVYKGILKYSPPLILRSMKVTANYIYLCAFKPATNVYLSVIAFKSTTLIQAFYTTGLWWY